MKIDSQLHGLGFSPDGRILAIVDRDSSVRLLERETAQELATLEAPNPQAVYWLAFNPDGGQLAAACWTHQIQVWDLRALRVQLAAIKLDWPASPLPAAASPPTAWPLRVRVDTNTEVLASPAPPQERRAGPTAPFK